MVSFVSVISFRSFCAFRFVVSGFSTGRFMGRILKKIEVDYALY